MKRALLVGINEYPSGEPLTSSLNDVNDFAELLAERCDFQDEEIRLLTESGATKAAIMKQLRWLVKGLKAGDRVVFFYSGHANFLPLEGARGHADRYYECICPYDCEWEGKNNICDRDFNRLFSRIPDGAKLVWVSDTCFSGGLQELEGVARRKMSGAVANKNAVLIAATKERGGAQEKDFKKEVKVNGLLTYFLLEALKEKNGLKIPLNKLMKKVARNVKQYGRTSNPSFDQEPELHGSPELINKAFLE